MMVSAFIEVPLLVWVDRFPRSRTASISLLIVALASIAAALSHNPWLFSLSLTVCFEADGIACGMAQAALMDGDPERREERMAEWTLAGVLGDLAAPLVLTLAAYVGIGWRGAMFVGAAITVLSALSIRRVELPAEAEEEEEEERPRLRTALANKKLLVWLLGVSLCGLLDETLVAFAALYIRDHLGGDVPDQSLVIAAFTIGGALGLLAMPRLLRRMSPLSLLLIASVGSTVSYVVWLGSDSILVAAGLMMLAGVFTALLYPLAKAQAYRAFPESSGLVNAINAMFAPIDLVLPLGLGWIADEFGVLTALSLLTVQPIVLGIMAVVFSKRGGGHAAVEREADRVGSGAEHDAGGELDPGERVVVTQEHADRPGSAEDQEAVSEGSE